jgi:hypothetical protein
VVEAALLTMKNGDTPGPWHSPFTEQLAVNHKWSEKINLGLDHADDDDSGAG